MTKGIFITFEGIDGVGKTTQLEKLYEKCVELGHSTIKTREPGGTELGKGIRRLLLDPDSDEMVENTETLLYAADRAQHVEEIIRPALAKGKVVLCDRFLDSSIAFQGFGLNRDLGLIKLVNEKVIGGVMPTLTFCLDLEPKLALARTGGDRIEQRGMDYYHRVRQGYHQIAESEPNRFFIVDATGSPEEIFQRVWEIISGRDLL